ncbi:MAG: Hsp20/alpha crystallin family protein [Myxococcales bacterium]|nr:Hsp20/alpha crystallin family protein [Myxococcales bacterium]MCB9719085.1 Hsp20/alpha crystallin family protein [Myxococcales bacterium]
MSTDKTTQALSKQPEQTAAVHEVGDRPVLAPPVDIFENEHEYRVLADLPGVAKQDVGLDLDKGELIVFAKRDVVRVGEGLALERREGDFRRVFRIPDEVDVTKVEASFEHGVLEVRLPKSERTKPRRISIKAVA